MYLCDLLKGIATIYIAKDEKTTPMKWYLIIFTIIQDRVRKNQLIKIRPSVDGITTMWAKIKPNPDMQSKEQ